MRMRKPNAMKGRKQKEVNLAAVSLDVLLVCCILTMHPEISSQKIAFSLSVPDFQMSIPQQAGSERNVGP